MSEILSWARILEAFSGPQAFRRNIMNEKNLRYAFSSWMLWKSHLLLQLIRGPIKGKLDPTSLTVPSLPNFTLHLLKGVRIAYDGTAKT